MIRPTISIFFCGSFYGDHYIKRVYSLDEIGESEASWGEKTDEEKFETVKRFMKESPDCLSYATGFSEQKHFTL